MRVLYGEVLPYSVANESLSNFCGVNAARFAFVRGRRMENVKRK